MILYDSGWQSYGYFAILISRPRCFISWRDWLFCWQNKSRKRCYRILGVEVERELPYSWHE